MFDDTRGMFGSSNRPFSAARLQDRQDTWRVGAPHPPSCHALGEIEDSTAIHLWIAVHSCGSKKEKSYDQMFNNIIIKCLGRSARLIWSHLVIKVQGCRFFCRDIISPKKWFCGSTAWNLRSAAPNIVSKVQKSKPVPKYVVYLSSSPSSR